METEICLTSGSALSFSQDTSQNFFLALVFFSPSYSYLILKSALPRISTDMNNRTL